MWMLLFNLHYADLGLEFLKVDLSQRLGEHIYELLANSNMLGDFSLSNTQENSGCH
jgi:hypothetical protein